MRLLTILTSLALLGGCSTSSGSIEGDPCDRSTTLESGATHPAAGRFELEHDGRTRRFQVRVPEGYDARRSVPLVFVNHGLSQSDNLIMNGTDMEPKADEEGFIAVFANGVSNSWNGGECCGTAQSEDVDDVGFFRAMLDYVQDDLDLCVDRRRVYATGFSNGGFMSYRLACEASDLFAAIAPIGGSLVLPKEDCAATQERPVPMLHVHGTEDTFVAYEGEGGFSAVRSVADWADLAGCEPSTEPAHQPMSMLDTTCITHTGCPDDVEVTLCTVEEGGHCWFGNSTCGTGVPGGSLAVGNNAEGIVTTDAVWDFLSRFRCETCGL